MTDPAETTGVMVYGKTRIPVVDAVLGEREGRLGWYATSDPTHQVFRSRMFYPKDMFTFETVAGYLAEAMKDSDD